MFVINPCRVRVCCALLFRAFPPLIQASKVAALGSHSQIVPFSADWHQIAFDGGLAVLVTDADGRIVCINSGSARLIAKRAAKDLAGSKLADLFPGPAANEPPGDFPFGDPRGRGGGGA